MSSLVVQCGACRQRFAAESWLAGKTVACSSCGSQIAVPALPAQGQAGAAGLTPAARSAPTPLSGSLDDLLASELSAPSVPHPLGNGANPLGAPGGMLPGMARAQSPAGFSPVGFLTSVPAGVWWLAGLAAVILIPWLTWVLFPKLVLGLVFAFGMFACAVGPMVALAGFIWLLVQYFMTPSDGDMVSTGLFAFRRLLGPIVLIWLVIRLFWFTCEFWDRFTWRPGLMILGGLSPWIVAIVGVLAFGGAIDEALYPSPPGGPQELFPLPSTPIELTGSATGEVQPGVANEMFLGKMGEQDVQFWVLRPATAGAPKSRPCVLMTGSGSTPLTGGELDPSHVDEFVPWVKAGFVVIAYSIPGEAPPDRGDGQVDASKFSTAVKIYRMHAAGLAQAAQARLLAETRAADIDPDRIYAAGFSSAGKQALLLTEHEPRIKGCVALAPVCDVRREVGPDLLKEIRASGLPAFSERCSPLTHVKRLDSPTLIVHARDDTIVAFDQSTAFQAAAQNAGKNVTLAPLAAGDHGAAVRVGTRLGIRFLAKLDGKLKLDDAFSEQHDPLPTDPSPPDPGTFARVGESGDEPDTHPGSFPRNPLNPGPTAKPQSPALPWTPVVDAALAAPRSEQTLWEMTGSLVRGAPIISRTGTAWVMIETNSRDERRFELHDPATGRLVKSHPDVGRGVVRVRDDGAYLATRFPTNEIEITNLRAGRRAAVLRVPGLGQTPAFEFVGRDELLVALPQDQRVTFCLFDLEGGGEPKARWDANPVDGFGGSYRAAISPGGRYAAIVGGKRAEIWEIATQRQINSIPITLERPLDPSARPATLCFSYDGRQLAALYVHNVSNLRVWAMDDGHLVENRKIDFPIINRPVFGSDAHEMRYLSDNSGWWLDTGHVLPRNEGLQLVKLGAQELGCRYEVAGLLDAQTALVAADGRIEAARFDWHNGGRLADEAKIRERQNPNRFAQPGFNQPPQFPQFPPANVPRPGFPQPGVPQPGVPGVVFQPDPPRPKVATEFAERNQKYLLNAYAHYLAGPVQPLIDNYAWSTGRKQPLIGVRWGVAVAFPEDKTPAPVETKQQLVSLTGPVGSALIDGLQQRLEKGTFGFWPDLGDAKARGVAFLGSGAKDDLFAAARANGVDALLTIEVTQQAIGLKKFDKVLRIKLNDVTGKTTAWASPTMTGQRAADKPELVVQWVNAALAKTEELYEVAPFPALTADVALRRVETLASASARDPLPALVEIRYYAAKNLLPADKALPIYQKFFGQEGARIFIEGSDAERRRLVDDLALKAK